MSLVIDASVALAWVFGDERNDLAWAVIEQLQREPAVVPTHFHLEFGNGLLVGMRRGRLTVHDVEAAVVALNALPIEVDVETPLKVFPECWSLASAHQLSTYDAAYLELASRRGLPLATLDAALARSALHQQVPLVIR